MGINERIVWSIDDLQVDVRQEGKEEVKVCTINFEDNTITFHRPVEIDTIKQIYYHYDDISKATSRGMAPVDDNEDEPPF